MKRSLFIATVLILLLANCKKDSTVTYDNLNTRNVSKIAFGSCYLQQFTNTQTIFNTIDSKNPDMYLNLGDMIYSDEFFSGNTHQNDWEQYLTYRYSQLFDSTIFTNFRNKYTIHSTWDDHDYGMNNAAGDFVNKQISKNVFFNMWGLPKSGKRWDRNGIYDVFYYGDDDHRVQLLFLDLRWGLDNPGAEPIAVITDQSKKMMSDEQWNWLKDELKKPAKIRIICSSTQFSTEHNGWEAWANFPHEQDRMYQLIRDTKAENLFFISGDVHAAEVNKRTPANLYPIWDFTSSGLLQFHGSNVRPSQYRVGNAQDVDNFGILDIAWGSNPTVTYTAYDANGTAVLVQAVNTSELKF